MVGFAPNTTTMRMIAIMRMIAKGASAFIIPTGVADSTSDDNYLTTLGSSLESPGRDTGVLKAIVKDFAWLLRRQK